MFGFGALEGKGNSVVLQVRLQPPYLIMTSLSKNIATVGKACDGKKKTGRSSSALTVKIQRRKEPPDVE